MEKKKKSSRPRNLCAVQGHSRQQTSVFHLVSSSFFIFSAGVFQPLVFVFPQQSLLHEETGRAMQLFFLVFFRLTQKPSRT